MTNHATLIALMQQFQAPASTLTSYVIFCCLLYSMHNCIKGVLFFLPQYHFFVSFSSPSGRHCFLRYSFANPLKIADTCTHTKHVSAIIIFLFSHSLTDRWSAFYCSHRYTVMMLFVFSFLYGLSVHLFFVSFPDRWSVYTYTHKNT